MDKKKVKELMEDTLLMVETIEGFDNGDTEQLLNVKHKLNEALEELSKSDWVSVEDGLPEYLKDVDVRIDDLGVIKYEVSHRSKRHPYFNEPIDENEFRVLNPADEKITHWKPIEKLEE